MGGGAMLTDGAWMDLEPLIETCRPKGKTPPQDLRRTISASRVSLACVSGPKLARTLGEPRTSRSSASPSGSVSSALASKHGIAVVLLSSGHRRRMYKGQKGPVRPRHARGHA